MARRSVLRLTGTPNDRCPLHHSQLVHHPPSRVPHQGEDPIRRATPYALALTLAALVGIAVVAAADAPAEPPSTLISIGTPAFYERCPGTQKAISYYRGKYREHREKMNQPGPVPRAWYPCDAARRRANEWRARATRTAAQYTLWLQQRTLQTNDWRTAVRLTQRVYPGTETWLLYISDREGGYGPFVMNHQGSGAGGWMQFMESTFYAYMPDARASVKTRGFKVDPAAWSWTHPLGQALTAGYMRYFGRDGCHWCL